MINHPHVRNLRICIACNKPKDTGLLICWPCNREQKRLNAGCYTPEIEQRLDFVEAHMALAHMALHAVFGPTHEREHHDKT
ncbi:MAG TPA: hypothetical protein VGU68_02295 [Ktedonobacteraceae bacterium]|nr:hypothetical protein [Ktedonobacteraceae bacterium]